MLEVSLNLEDVDYSGIKNQNLSNADSLTAEDDASKVSRRTRVSFDRALEDMMNDLDPDSCDLLDSVGDIVSLFTMK